MPDISKERREALAKAWPVEHLNPGELVTRTGLGLTIGELRALLDAADERDRLREALTPRMAHVYADKTRRLITRIPLDFDWSRVYDSGEYGTTVVEELQPADVARLLQIIRAAAESTDAPL